MFSIIYFINLLKMYVVNQIIPTMPEIATLSTKQFILSKVCTDDGGIK